MEQLCRTCHSAITSDDCIALNDNIVNSARVKSQLLSCVPELQQDLVKDPVLCSACVSALHAAYTFKSQCLETEERIRNYFLSTKLSEKSVTFIELYKQVINVGAVCNSLEQEDSVKALKIVGGGDSDENPDAKACSINKDINSEDVANAGIVKVECDLTQFKVEENIEDDYFVSGNELEKLSLLQFLDESLQQITPKQLKNSEDDIPFDGRHDLTRSQFGNVSKTTFSRTRFENRCGIMEAVESSNNGKKDEYLKKNNLVSDVITNVYTNGEDDVQELPTKECSVQLVRIEDVARLQSGNALEATFSSKRPKNQCVSTDTDPSINGKGQQDLLTENSASNVLIRTDEKPYGCKFCEFRTSLQRTLIQHMQSHTEEKPLQCHICEYRTADRSNLNSHIRIHSGEKPFECSVCEFRTARRENLRAHIKTHTGEKPLRCSICEFRTAYQSSLKIHMGSHTMEKPFQCSVCKYRTMQQGHLKTHMRTHTGEKPFTCTICEFRTVRESDLKRHLKTHTGEKPFRCIICEFSTARQVSLKEHMRLHSGEKAFQCKICEFRATQRSSLKRHLRTHTEETFLQCTMCGFRATSAYFLSKHMITHTGKAPFQCNICGYLCVTKSRLKSHTITHAEEKTLVCGICEFRTAHRSSLKNHMRTHTGEKPFQCSVCEHSTANPESLKIHMRIHTGKKPFQCSICDVRTTQRAHLKTHMITHTGQEKTFHCNICAYRTVRKCNLKSHMKTHTLKKH